MCIHIGGLLHKVQTLKTHCNIESVPCEKTTTTATDTPENVRDNSEVMESSSGQLRKCHRMKRKKRVKMYVCGICMSQFSDKVTFMNHCQQNHTLPEFLSSNNHKRKRNKQTNVNTAVNEDSCGIYSKHLPSTPNGILLENDVEKEFHREICDHTQARVGPADIIDLDNFIGADEMSVDEFLLAQRPYETEYNAIEVADDVNSLAEQSDIVSTESDRTATETLLIKQEPDLIIIDEDLEALEQCS